MITVRSRSARRHPAALATTLLLVVGTSPARPAAAQAPPDAAQQVDAIFARWDTNQSAGCAVGIIQNGLTVLERAYGMADLEHDIPNTPETIFEGGSLSKQFTSAAVILLALDGKLSLDDDVRKYVPELPDYGHTITLRHMMNHTSGLRDWGSVAEISGWGREQRAHDQDDVVDILSRQSALNFEPGHEYSYSNSGFNLLAIIVGRVSGEPFADFSRERIFEPLGLRHTQWRDDFRRIVPNRSTAYNATDDGWEINRPTENVIGNGGITTTVGDLGIWAQALTDGRLGGPRFLEMMHHQGHLNDGSEIVYASGLMIQPFMGVPSITHTGSTAGYRAFIGRYPDQHLSVSMLCNASNVPTGGTGGRVARVYLGDAAKEPTPNQAWANASRDAAARFAGLYADPVTGFTRELVLDGETLRDGRTPLVQVGATDFAPETGATRYRFSGSGGSAELVLDDWEYTDQRYERVQPWSPNAADLQAFVGSFHSDDAETTLVVRVQDGALTVWRRANDTFTTTPVYADTFEARRLGTIRFRRDASGRVNGLSLSLGRVYDMRFDRVAG